MDFALYGRVPGITKRIHPQKIQAIRRLNPVSIVDTLFVQPATDRRFERVARQYLLLQCLL